MTFINALLIESVTLHQILYCKKKHGCNNAWEFGLLAFVKLFILHKILMSSNIILES